ncbi:MAG: galactokinase [Spirochaetaceae bacterium]|jgi:galactokinase|nr:galactokinase [Spirochaetaceae bacterium]
MNQDTQGAAAPIEAVYGPDKAGAAAARYAALIAGMPEAYRGAARLFSAPGRAELGGNHTDHNRGKVLAASLDLDIAAAAAPAPDKQVVFRSAGYPLACVDLSNLAPRAEERGTTAALIRGIAAGFVRKGAEAGGFTASADSAVLPGSGLSSSAAAEVLVGLIYNVLYNNSRLSALEIAKIGQDAENNYFGKPSGLMDQAASAIGGAAAIDFKDPVSPAVRRLAFNPEDSGYALCVVNTGGSHADLTADYAAVQDEMKAVARFFGKSVLREVEGLAVERLQDLRGALGDRAVVRALHFFNENRRVDAMTGALTRAAAGASGAFAAYLALVNQSCDSSWELLQNSYSLSNPREQPISLALALTRAFFDHTAIPFGCRVQGGGFAGTIQAYIPQDLLAPYCAAMDQAFGGGSVTAVRIRPLGAVEIAAP